MGAHVSKYGSMSLAHELLRCAGLLLLPSRVLNHAGLRIKENKEVYEGEVTELTPEEAPSQTGGYGKVISHVVIGLKSVKGTKQLKLDPTIYDRYPHASSF